MKILICCLGTYLAPKKKINALENKTLIYIIKYNSSQIRIITLLLFSIVVYNNEKENGT